MRGSGSSSLGAHDDSREKKEDKGILARMAEKNVFAFVRVRVPEDMRNEMTTILS